MACVSIWCCVLLVVWWTEMAGSLNYCSKQHSSCLNKYLQSKRYFVCHPLFRGKSFFLKGRGYNVDGIPCHSPSWWDVFIPLPTLHMETTCQVSVHILPVVLIILQNPTLQETKLAFADWIRLFVCSLTQVHTGLWISEGNLEWRGRLSWNLIGTTFNTH